MKKIIWILFFFIYNFSFASFFASDAKNKPDSYYFTVTAGYPVFYGLSEPLYQQVKDRKENSFYNGFGVYFSLNKNWLIGIKYTYILPVAFDTPDIDFSFDSVDICTQVFFNKIGNGFFIQGGLGSGFISVDKKNSFSKESDFGLFARGGIGYAFEYFQFENSLLLGLDVFFLSSKQGAEKWKVLSGAVYIGVLW
ncbi:MAG TPA: hypothetical protein DHW82_08145 [Spirochaetia bacterium]|nr:MAG: hypothetical protein A2Y41_06770 [Spirochaetes bacterium GWB1_36_13]HCL56964.1 hypothetical protein [Spirochaetia bacterium]